MRLKKCLKCGKLFNTAKNEQAMCDDCLAATKSSTIRPRTCRQCGAVFDGGPRAWYCPTCREIRKKADAKRYRKTGASRPLGSIDRCTVCGKEYVVNGGRQRYCPDCAPEAVREVDRAASRAWNAAHDWKAKRRETPRNGQKVCVICGQPVPPGTPAVTCSPECNKLRLKRLWDDADIRRGKRKSPTTVKRLDKDDEP